MMSKCLEKYNKWFTEYLRKAKQEVLSLRLEKKREKSIKNVAKNVLFQLAKYYIKYWVRSIILCSLCSKC